MTGSEMLRSIAADIERQGHWRSPESYRELYSAADNVNGRCCVIANPTNARARKERGWVGWQSRLLRSLGLASNMQLAAWSDKTSTEEVLATLRRLADEWEQEAVADD